MSIDKDLFGPTDGKGRAPGDLFGKEAVTAHLTKALAEPAFCVEIAASLPKGANPLSNRRNGSSPKTATTESGKVLPGIPRHRNGGFDPIPIAKDRRRFP